MTSVGAYDAKTHLPRLLDRVERGESLTITRHVRPVEQLGPVDSDREQAKAAAARIVARRQRLKRVPLEELIDSIHEGHRY